MVIIQNYQRKKTKFSPQSRYAAGKLYAYWITKIYRNMVFYQVMEFCLIMKVLEEVKLL